MPRRFKRALFVIVDALRFDFTLYTRPSPSAKGASVAAAADIDADLQDDYYVNNLPVINDLLLNNASNTLLFRFVADAPTTTLQRLKALNTGGIPTFLEAKNNFDSSELSEDNLILQLRDNGRGAVFMGDDTWAKLFPPHKRYFTRSHPFPSFNVKDLHTVDDGVMRHLFPEMRNEPAAGAHFHSLCASAFAFRSFSLSLSFFLNCDGRLTILWSEGEEGWEVIVAHFLGVDHAGHRFGPSHPQMRQKLRQMNGILQQVSAHRLLTSRLLHVSSDCRHGLTCASCVPCVTRLWRPWKRTPSYSSWATTA
jgi:phosphatidylinositol glycan class O